MKPDDQKPEPGKPTVRSSREAWLEPMPQPDVVESNTETAWGRWEDSLQSTAEPEPDFADTEPMTEAEIAAMEKLLRR